MPESKALAVTNELSAAIAEIITPTGLAALPDDLPYEQWDDIGVVLSRFQQATQWAWGDWIRFGDDHYHDRYTQAKAMTGREEHTLMNIASVCRAYPDAESRQRDVSFTVYAEVASIARESAQEAQDVLQRAEEGGWTASQTRAELRPSVTTTKPGRYTVAELQERFERWPARAEYRNNLNKGVAAFLEWLS